VLYFSLRVNCAPKKRPSRFINNILIKNNLANTKMKEMQQKLILNNIVSMHIQVWEEKKYKNNMR